MFFFTLIIFADDKLKNYKSKHTCKYIKSRSVNLVTLNKY